MKGKKTFLKKRKARASIALVLAMVLALSPATTVFGSAEDDGAAGAETQIEGTTAEETTAGGIAAPTSEAEALMLMHKPQSAYREADKDQLDAHMKVLSQDIGVRLLGTPGEAQAARYVMSCAKKFGYSKAYEQNFDLKQSLKTEVIIGGETYYGNYYGPVIGSLANVAVSEITGMPGDGNNFSAKIPVIGKDALVQMAGGTTPSAINTKVVELAGSLKEKGAQGLIIYNNVKTQEGNWVSMSLKGLDALAPAIPVFALDGATGKLLLEQKGSELLAPYTQKKSSNVVMVKESYKSKPDAIIHVTAHMDSAMASPGASDNASGLAALLELARIYRTVKTGGVEIRFVAVGAEEGGLNGSRAYVDSLTAAEKAISINYNMDMIATSWPDATVVSLDVNPRDTGIFNLPAALIIAGAETLPWIPGTENVRWYQYGSSDHVPFQDAKIDAASMIRATDATDDIEPADHTTGDDMAGNYSRERLWEAANMMSKGISRAIDNKLTLHLEYTVKSSGKVEVTNWENLKFLFDSLKITLQPKDGKEAIFITASSKDKFQFALPVGECTMTALGCGVGTANVKGTLGMAKSLPYVTNLGSYEIIKPVSKNMSIGKVQVMAGGELQSQTRADMVTKGGLGEYYTSSRMASMTDPRLFTIKTMVDYGDLGLENVSQFDKNRLSWTYGGKDLSQWKKLSGETTKSAISVQSVTYRDAGHGKVEVTTQILFGSFFDETKDANKVNAPYVGYSATTKTAFPIFKNESASPLGIHNLSVKYGEEVLGDLQIRLNLYDSYHTWSQIEKTAQELKAQSESAGNMIKGKYVKVESIGRSWGGRDVWNVVIAKDPAAVADYLNVTKPLLMTDPKALQTQLGDKKTGNEKKHKAVIYFNNVHPDETPGSDGIIEMVKALAENAPSKTLSYQYMETVSHRNPTATASGFTMETANPATTLKNFTIEEILNNFILVFNFTENPDGRYNLARTNNYGFDLNRDAAYQTQPEVIALTKDLVKWQPLTMTEYHGYVTELLMEPCTGPHDPNYEYDLFAKKMLDQGNYMGRAMIGSTAYKQYLVPATDYTDGWDDGAPVYGPMFAMLFGTMGYTLEIPYSTQDSVDAVLKAGFAMMDDCENNRDVYLSNFAEYKLRGVNNEDSREVDKYLTNPYKQDGDPNKVVGRPRSEGKNFFPEYYVIPVDKTNQRNPLEAYKTLQVLERNGVMLQQTTVETAYGGKTLPVGTYIIDMHQADRGYINSMLSTGYDGSVFEDIYAELVVAYPEMRNFDRITVQDKDIFKGKAVSASKVTRPVTAIVSVATKVAISNNNIDTVRLVNRLLKAGKSVEMLTADAGNAKKGDFIINKADLTCANDAQKGNLLVYGTGFDVSGTVSKAALMKPSMEILGSTAHSQYVLDILEFDTMYKYVVKPEDVSGKASVIVGFNNSGNVAAKIAGGIPYIGIGTNALSFAKSANILQGFDYLRPGASYNEGLVKAAYSDSSLITAGYGRTDAAYTMNGTFINKVPAGGKALITISKDNDFFKSGWYPNHDGLKGQFLAVSGYAGAGKDVPVTLFANNLFSKGHAQHTFNMFANAVYLASADIAPDSGSGNIGGNTGGSTGGSSGGGSSSDGGSSSGGNPPLPGTEPPELVNFDDVSPQSWYSGAVNFVTMRNLFSGTGEKIFNPNGYMTRGMLVTVLHRMAKTPTPTAIAGFEDVPQDAWYAAAVNWAAEKDIVSGTGKGFEPSKNVTREQLAVVLYGYAKNTGAAMTPVGNLANFADGSNVSPWAREAMSWAIGQGIISGKDHNTIDPKGSATRAEVASMLQRFITANPNQDIQ